jgi:hypothetical protein
MRPRAFFTRIRCRAAGSQFGVIEKRPAFERYCQRLSARPAALRAKEIDDALSAQPVRPSG